MLTMRTTSQLQLVLLLSVALAVYVQCCSTDFDCSLNGVCTSGKCACDVPWGGDTCGELQYKVTPASGKNLYNTSDPRNTWNGPIVQGLDNKYHLYNPLYNVGSLGGPMLVMHGIADNIEGPWDWSSQKPVCEKCGENPAAVKYTNASSNSVVFTVWVGGKIWSAATAYGPFAIVEGGAYPGGNPAPVYHNGAFYMTNQRTTEVYTTPTLRNANWTKFSDISHDDVPANWNIEDPFMWVDKRGNWHIINHAYNNYEYNNCGNSTLSAHFFSPDGITWSMTGTRPYDHTVQYDDGTTHTYTTLERPNLHFDSTGQLTHINVAADLIVGNEGCGNRTKHAHNGHTPCDNCKWDDHAGTVLISLDV